MVAIANGCFFNLGARLARYTSNETYAKFAEETWDWLWAVEYIDHDNWMVYDGAHVEHNCTDINKATFSYNAAILLQGAAFMYNYVSRPLDPILSLLVCVYVGYKILTIYRPMGQRPGKAALTICSSRFSKTSSPKTSHTKSLARTAKVPVQQTCFPSRDMSTAGSPS